MKEQRHMPNPRVNRNKRKNILAKRIRGIEKQGTLPIGDIRIKRLGEYKHELKTLGNK